METNRITVVPRRADGILRCPGCYLPMRSSFARAAWYCDFCEGAVTDERHEDRPRWRRLLDRLMGMGF